MRGKRRGYTYSLHQKRITPAGAGKTVTDTYHPHIHAGSPPQVRGKQAAESCQAAMLRITPAGAGKTFRIPLAVRPSKDHPRRCGENHIQRKLSVCKQGSPPQVRGKPERDCPDKDNPRITPAGAGKTVLCLCYRLSEQDHPRRCGENSLFMQNVFSFKGSPPQVRGKQRDYDGGRRKRRITPAGAGKTSTERPVSIGT